MERKAHRLRYMPAMRSSMRPCCSSIAFVRSCYARKGAGEQGERGWEEERKRVEREKEREH
eukprot:1931918-Rhodomonas_salina.1